MKESRVGGPFNDWDRSSYYQRAGCSRSGAVTPIPQFNTIRRNFFMNGYAGHACLDHDDGGRRYVDEENLLVYGAMENHDGTDKLYQRNMIVFPGVANHSQYGKPCFEDTPDMERTDLDANNTLRGNTCWVTSDFVLLANSCNASSSQHNLSRTVSIKSHNDSYNTPSGSFRVSCRCAPTPGSPETCLGDEATRSVNFSLAQWQARGVDRGSSVARLAPEDQLLAGIIARARQLLDGKE